MDGPSDYDGELFDDAKAKGGRSSKEDSSNSQGWNWNSSILSPNSGRRTTNTSAHARTRGEALTEATEADQELFHADGVQDSARIEHEENASAESRGGSSQRPRCGQVIWIYQFGVSFLLCNISPFRLF